MHIFNILLNRTKEAIKMLITPQNVAHTMSTTITWELKIRNKDFIEFKIFFRIKTWDYILWHNKFKMKFTVFISPYWLSGYYSDCHFLFWMQVLMHPAMTRLQNSEDFNKICLVQLHMNKKGLNLKPKIYFDHLWVMSAWIHACIWWPPCQAC